jgi:Flp pilus assembly protein TadG
MMLMKPLREIRNKNRQRGSSVVELALLLPLLVFLFLGTWSFGYAYYVYAELESAVRAGARYSSLITYDASGVLAYQAAIQNMVVYGDPAGASQPVVPGLQTSNVSVVVGTSSNGVPASVTVSISGYTVPAMYFSPVTLTNKPSLQIPFLGNYVPL